MRDLTRHSDFMTPVIPDSMALQTLLLSPESSMMCRISDFINDGMPAFAGMTRKNDILRFMLLGKMTQCREEK
jgi:hypothetical protein